MKPAVIIKVFGIFTVVVLGIGVVGLVLSVVLDLDETRYLALGSSGVVLACGAIGALLRARMIRKSRQVADPRSMAGVIEAQRAVLRAPVDEAEFAVLVERIRDRFAGQPCLVEQGEPHSIIVLADPTDPSVRSKLSDGGLDTVAGVEVTVREGNFANVKPFRQKVEFADGVARLTDAREPGGSTYTKTVNQKHDVGHTDVDTQMIYTDDTDLVTPVFEVLAAESWRSQLDSPIPDLIKLLPPVSMLSTLVAGFMLAFFTLCFVFALAVFLLI